MNAVIWERSTLSADGSQRSSPRPDAVVFSTAALISPRARRSRSPPAPDVAVEQPHEVQREAVGALERVGVDAVGDVVVGVLGRYVTLGRDAGDGRRAVAVCAREHRVAAVAVAYGAGARPIAVGRRDRLAEAGEVVVHEKGHDPAGRGLVAHLAFAHRVQTDDVARLAVDVVAVGAQEGAHALLEALLAAGEHDPDVEVLGSVRLELLRHRDRGGDAGGIVVGAGRGRGKGDVDQEGGPEHQDDGGEELEEADPVALDAGHARAEDGEKEGNGPEEDAKGPEREAEGVLYVRAEVLRPVLERSPGAWSVVVGAEDHSGRRVGSSTARDHVLGNAAEEKAAQ